MAPRHHKPGTRPSAIQRQVKHRGYFQEHQCWLERDGSQSWAFRGGRDRGGEQAGKTLWSEWGRSLALQDLLGRGQYEGRHREDAEGVPQDLSHQFTKGPHTLEVFDVFRSRQAGRRQLLGCLRMLWR